MITNINNEDRLVQETFANHLEQMLGWESVYAWKKETFGPQGTLGRADTREVVLKRHLFEALKRLNPLLPERATNEAIDKLTHFDLSRSLVQHNQTFHSMIRDGVPVSYRDAKGQLRHVAAQVIDFNNPENNRFVAVRELRITGRRSPGYNRRADLVCFVNGLPLVFIELKAVHRNIRTAFEGNLKDYLDEHVIAHAFHHNVFLVVSNGHRARYGTITSEWDHFSEWKRLQESDKGKVTAEVLLNGMLDKARLLDIVENFVLFDNSKPGAVRKVVARNHQVMGVNNAVAAVLQQEELKREFPTEARLTYRVVEVPREQVTDRDTAELIESGEPRSVRLPELAHPKLGKLGVFWHTQGSGKSYSMAFFAEKVRRKIPGNFTFVVMTDRNDLDNQIYRTFVGCGVANQQPPRAGSGKQLKEFLEQNHRYIFSLIHKFNQDVNPAKPYSLRDDIIVISDEAHRTQAGRLARNMRAALPNAAFIGFTGTPLFKHDHLTRRIFGDYVSRYDFKRSEEDGATVKLVYENRGEKLGIARMDLNERIRAAIEKAELDSDREALLQKLLGKDYEVITADDRLDKIAADFVRYVSARWESGKSMLVCIDKTTCGRMHQRIMPRWQGKIEELEKEIAALEEELSVEPDEEIQRELLTKRVRLKAQIRWMSETRIQVIVSEAQNEVADFAKWGFDIKPHRKLMKQGFETADGKRVDVESAFKNPDHPFRIAIVCAMWLTGFDVESLSALYVDKPMKAHTLMQAIARANRRFPGKDFGLIVDYNGILKSLREALAQYALGDEEGGEEEILEPVEKRVKALLAVIEAAEAHLRGLGFDPATLAGKTGFEKAGLIRDGVNAVRTTDDSRQRFEILARLVFTRFKALLAEPSAYVYAERHDNIEALYRMLSEHIDTTDVTEVLKALQRIVNQAIITDAPGGDQVEEKQYDLSQINLEKLRDEFVKKVKHKATTLQDIRTVVDARLSRMLMHNPRYMDYYRKYQEIIAEYNQEKERVTIEDTFAKLVELAKSLDAEQQRAVKEGLSEDELALFDMLVKDELSKADRDRLKEASRGLLKSMEALVKPMERWTEKEQTQAEVRVFILDHLFAELPDPPYSPKETEQAANRIYDYTWQRSASGTLFPLAA